jgi:aconitate hydratase
MSVLSRKCEIGKPAYRKFFILTFGMGTPGFYRGKDYVDLHQTALRVRMLQHKWRYCNLCKLVSLVAVPTTVHCDHLIQAKLGADLDLQKCT